MFNDHNDSTSKEKLLLHQTGDALRLYTSEANYIQNLRLLDFHFSVMSPEVTVDLADNKKLHLSYKGMEEEYEKIRSFLGVKEKTRIKVGFIFENKGLRDLFILIFRCFAARKYLMNNRIVEEFSGLEKLDNLIVSAGKNKLNFNNASDVFLEVEKLRRTLEVATVENKNLNEKIVELTKKNKKFPEGSPDEKQRLDRKVYELEEALHFEKSRSTEKICEECQKSLSSEKIKRTGRKNEKSEPQKNQDPSNFAEERRKLELKIYELEQTLIFERKKQEETDLHQSFMSDYSVLDHLKERENPLETENKKLKFRVQELEGFLISTPKKEKWNYESESKMKSRISELEGLLKDKSPTKDRTHIDLLKLELTSYKQKVDSLNNELRAVKEQNKKKEFEEILKEKDRDDSKYKDELEKFRRDSYIQRSKLIEERDSYKTAFEQIRNGSKIMDSSNTEYQEVDKLRGELELAKRNSIIERGKLIEEKNRLKQELEKMRSGNLNVSLRANEENIKKEEHIKRGGNFNVARVNIENMPKNISNENLESTSGKSEHSKNCEEIVKELEDTKRRSILERAKLIEEKNKLKEEINNVKLTSETKLKPFLEEKEALNNKMASLQMDIEKMKRSHQLLEEEKIRSDELNEKYSNEKNELEKRNLNLFQNLENITKIKNEIDEEKFSWLNKFEHCKIEKEKYSNELIGSQLERNHLTTLKERLQGDNAKLSSEISIVNSQLKELIEENNNLRLELEKLNFNHENLKNDSQILAEERHKNLNEKNNVFLEIKKIEQAVLDDKLKYQEEKNFLLIELEIVKKEAINLKEEKINLEEKLKSINDRLDIATVDKFEKEKNIIDLAERNRRLMDEMLLMKDGQVKILNFD